VTISRIGGIAALALATTFLAGCSLFVSDAERAPVAPEAGSPVEEGPFPEHSASALPEFERSTDPRIVAAHDLIIANYEAIKAEDWALACSMYSDLYVEKRVVTIADAPAGSSCEEALEYAFGGASDFIASFDEGKNAEGLYIEQQVMPFFYTPTAVTIDDGELTADNDQLVYSTGLAVYGQSEYAFTDDSGATKRSGNSAPWQAVSTYFALVDGEWKYIDTTEKLSFD